VPAHAGALEPLRFLVGEEAEVGQRVLERRLAESAGRIQAAQRLRCWIARVKRPCAVPRDVTNKCSHSPGFQNHHPGEALNVCERKEASANDRSRTNEGAALPPGLGVKGRSKMTKSQLKAAIGRRHR